MKEIVIMGCANLENVPEEIWYDQEKYEIWTLGVAIGDSRFKRVDSIFELHCEKEINSSEKRAQDLKNFISANPDKQVWMKEEYISYKNDNVKRYPFEKIMWNYKTKYIANSFVLMMLLAWAEGQDTIYLYGIDLATERELEIELRCLEYWIGYLRGKGGNIILDKNTKLCKCKYIYGYEDIKIQDMLVEIDKRIDENEENRRKSLHYMDLLRSEYAKEESEAKKTEISNIFDKEKQRMTYYQGRIDELINMRKYI